MDNFKPIKVAFLGLENGHGLGMFQAMLSSPYYNVVAVSTYLERVELVKMSTGNDKIFDGIDLYIDDDKKLIDKYDDLDLVVCAGENSRHLEEFKLACSKKIDTIVMKVPTMDEDEFNEMLRLEKESGIKVFIELEMRWYASVERIKDLIAKGELGEITSISAFNFSHFPTWNKWTTNPLLSYGKKIPIKKDSNVYRGGCLTDHPHIFDLIRYITGSDFDCVYAEVAPNMRDYVNEEDLIYIIGKLKNGTTVSLDPSYSNIEYKQERMEASKYRLSHYPKAVQVELAITGTKGSLICDAYNPNTTEQIVFDDHEYRVNCRFADISGNRVTFLEKIARVIRGYEPYNPEITLKEHKKSIDVMNACYESVYQEKVIKL